MVLALLSSLCFGQPDDVKAARAAIETWSERYAIDLPWVEPKEAPRYRGAFAHVARRLRGVGEDVRILILRDLGRLLALDATTEAGRAAILEQRAEHVGKYAKLFDTDVYALWKRLIVPESAPETPWGKAVREYYYSKADGIAERFEVRLPPKVEGQDRYPLIVVLKGGPRVGPSREQPFIQVRPSNRGVWGPCSLGGWDVMQVVDFMKRYYPVDPDRISLVGFSAGASFAMHLAGRHADEFAAVMPMVAFGTGVPLFNLKNLPVAAHHGAKDWTSAACNVRVQARKLKELGYPTEYFEYPGAGHSVPGPHDRLVEWMLKQRRDPCPKAVGVECETPALGRSYWIRILEFEDPHRLARIEASLEGDAVAVAARNVARFSVDLDLIREKRGMAPRTVAIGDQRLEIGGPRFRLRGGKWGQGEGRTSRPYSAGAATNLYQGQPLLLVYGTGSEDGRRKGLILKIARKLSRFGGPYHGVIRTRFPVVSDSELTAEQVANCNLLLIGIPEENRITGKLLPDLPIAIREGGLEAGKRPALPLEHQVLSLLARHPKHPDRLVYVVAPFTDVAGLERFEREAPQQSLIGSDGLDRFSQADLVVRNLDGAIGRQMKYDKEWAWIEPPGSRNPLPARFRDRAEIARALTDVMRRGSDADVALWWGPADKGMWGYDFNVLDRFNPATFTEADIRVRQGNLETMIGGATGRELKEIWGLWGKNKELVFSPRAGIEALEDEQSYRVRIPMDLYIKLGRRKKTLHDPVFGPPITPEEFRSALFR